MEFLRKPLVIGNTPRWPSRCMISPLEGVFTPAFIRAADSLHLVNGWMTPFISVTKDSVPSTGALRRRLAPWLENGLPLCVQLLGHDKEGLCGCTENLLKIGIKSIDLNFACPSRTVMKNGSGAFLLDDPRMITWLTRGVSTMLPPDVLLSVKLRAGNLIDATGEVVSAAIDGGASLIIFHYRTAAEGYAPCPDGLSRLNQAVITADEIPVIGNGDIHDEASAKKMFLYTGCAGVTIGRAFLREPDILLKLLGGEGLPHAAESLYEALKKFKSPLGPMKEFARYANLPF